MSVNRGLARGFSRLASGKFFDTLGAKTPLSQSAFAGMRAPLPSLPSLLQSGVYRLEKPP